MNFKKYQKNTSKTAIFKETIPESHHLTYLGFGLSGEAGEILDKLKKVYRDKGGEIDEADREEISKEIGDVLWYLSELASKLDLSLDEIAERNIDKLASRQERDRIQGSGDNR